MVVQLVVSDAGIASMHTAVLHTGTVIFLDRTNIGPSHMKLANGFCRNSSTEMVSLPAGLLMNCTFRMVPNIEMISPAH